MPTIEIASINSGGLDLDQSEFDVAIIEQNQLVSHRGLFTDALKKENGTIVHIGNPDFRSNKENAFFAGQLIDWDAEPGDICIPSSPGDTGSNQQFRFKILSQFKSDIDRLLKIALDKSPIKRIFFFTDYQFGPENGNVEIIFTIDDFWALHDQSGLSFNTLYEIYGQ